MEYVQGESILSHADRVALDIRARLELILEVAQAVEHAHQRLVVHRDLKPSNILIGSDGRPKLLDFGIAKIVRPLTADAVDEATGTVNRWMTLAYASPEQVAGAPTTTATDVFGLGVVLFELLTGVRPRSTGIGAAPAAGPTAPALATRRASTAAREEDVERSVDRAARRGLTPERLSRSLRGDLDNILAKALAPEPERRYGSVAAFADDIRRHLAGLPVAARPDRFSYRFGKFITRHRLEVAVGGIALAVLIATLIIALQQARIAGVERDRARHEAETAYQVSEFLVTLFKVNEPGEALGNQVTARQLLDQGAVKIEQELQDQPLVRARLLRAMGRAYGELGLYESEGRALEREMVVESDALGPQSLEVAATGAILAKSRMNRGAYAEARDLALRSLAIQERELGLESPEVARTLSQLGLSYWYLGDLVTARKTLERSLELQEKSLGTEHVDLGGILNNVAILRWQEGDTEGARPLYERALLIFEREHGPNHPSVAHTLNNLALIELAEGDLARSRALHERALASRRSFLAPDHPDIAESLNNLGQVLRVSADLGGALASLEQARVIREQVLGPGHPLVATTLNNLGLTYLGLGRLADARRVLDRAVEIFTLELGADHPNVAFPLSALATLDHRTGDDERAVSRFARAIALMTSGLGPDHPDLRRLHAEYSAVLGDLGRTDEAAEEKRLATAPLQRNRPQEP